jgi:hypothetical protein
VNRTALALVVALVVLCMALDGAAAIPPATEVRQAVLRYFQGRPDYRPGDMITREATEPLLNRLREVGLPLSDAKQILADMPSTEGFLAKQLSTPNGRDFMRQISRYPDAYDRLDRLSRLPRGQKTVRELIRGPDGYKMIQYMTTAKGGRQLGKQLSNSPGAGDFNAPTGRIYTVEDLLRRLEKSRAAALKAAGR